MNLTDQIRADLATLATATGGLAVDLTVVRGATTLLVRGWWREEVAEEPTAKAWIRGADYDAAGLLTSDVLGLPGQAERWCFLAPRSRDAVSDLVQLALGRAELVTLRQADDSTTDWWGRFSEDDGAESYDEHDRGWRRTASLRLPIAAPVIRTTRVERGGQTWIPTTVFDRVDARFVRLRRVEPIDHHARPGRIRG